MFRRRSRWGQLHGHLGTGSASLPHVLNCRIWFPIISTKKPWVTLQEGMLASSDHIWCYSAKAKSLITIKDVLKFFVQYMKNDQLGMIANAHLGLPLLTDKLKQKLLRTIILIGWNILNALVSTQDDRPLSVRTCRVTFYGSWFS